jgi:hypothetical protein
MGSLTGRKTSDAVRCVRFFFLVTTSFWWTNPWEKKLYRVKADSFSVSFPSGTKATVVV